MMNGSEWDEGCHSDLLEAPQSPWPAVTHLKSPCHGPHSMSKPGLQMPSSRVRATICMALMRPPRLRPCAGVLSVGELGPSSCGAHGLTGMLFPPQASAQTWEPGATNVEIAYVSTGGGAGNLSTAGALGAHRTPCKSHPHQLHWG